jgi:predicted ArsR family transcriptional regulator
MSPERKPPPGAPPGAAERALLCSIEAVGALEDDVRRDLYLFVRDAGRPVTRDEAAAGAGVSIRLAGFHLDKLVDRGLLRAHYARKPGRSGPGAGRTSKFYELSGTEVSVSLPSRSYDLIGEILVSALAVEAAGRSPTRTAFEVAARKGAAMGQELRGSRTPPSRSRALAVAADALRELGFEPYRPGRPRDGAMELRNCPFHRLARQHPDLVCGINHAFIGGLVEGLGSATVHASLEPTPGQCCVKLRSEPPKAGSG